MKTAACLVVKNEARTILEWIAFHLVIGFDALIIYDNASTDGTAEVAAKAAFQFDVRVLSWTDTTGDYQTNAYMHAIAEFGSEFDWMAFIDSDEFLVLPRDKHIQAFLGHFGGEAAIGAPWAVYGSSARSSPPDDLVIASYLNRSPEAFGPNVHVKSILRPNVVKGPVNPHVFMIDGGYVGPDRTPLNWIAEGRTDRHQSFEIARINHYFVRSRQDWAAKLARGYHDHIRTDGEFELYDRNEVLDDSALVYAPDVRRVMALIAPRALS